MKIRIVSPPVGEAPPEVRAAWVGLSLPLAYEGRGVWKGFGVISGPKLWITQMIGLVLGRAIDTDGYGVDAHEAIELLSSHNPDAAQWWKENAPHTIAKGQFFVFDADACEEIDDHAE